MRGDKWHPAVDVFETEAAVVVRLELAGVRAEDLKVDVDGQLVRIRGVRQMPVVEGVRRLHQMEIAFGLFESELRIAIPFDRDRVSAHLDNGLLEVRLPRRGPVTVEVKTHD